MNAGIVYCLTNPEMPGLVKIGRVEEDTTDALKRRMQVLYSSGVPVPFELHYAVAVDEVKQTENLLHDAFSHSRENPRREFFRIAPERVVAAMKLTRGRPVTVDNLSDGGDDAEIGQADIAAQQKARQRENRRLSAFSFSGAGIEPGETLVFSRDDSITAKVLDDRKIEFEGEEASLSGAAGTILKREGLYASVAGTLYWRYNGETLREIHERKEAEKEEGLEADD